MAVRARTARLRSRLRRLQTELPRAASRGAYDAAEGVKNFVQVQVQQDWQGAESQQVGFDLGNFIRIIDDVEVTGEGGYGILNINKMGTAEDFEQIAGVPTMWHMGLRMGDSFRRLIVEKPATRQMLAADRQTIWGSKEPQWWFMNYGNLGMPGAYPVHAGTYSIEDIAYSSAGSVQDIVERSVNEYLTTRGILV